MTLSEIVSAELLGSTGITESAGTFSSGLRQFSKDMELINKAGDTRVFKRFGDDLFVEDYDADREDPDAVNRYVMYDLVWKDNKLQYVSNITGKTIKQPWEYDAVDTSILIDNWVNRYMSFGTLDYRNSDDTYYYKFNWKYENGLFLYIETPSDNSWYQYQVIDTTRITTQYGYYNDDTDYSYIDVNDAKFHYVDNDGNAQEVHCYVHDISLETGDLVYFIFDFDGKGDIDEHDTYVLEVGDQISDEKYQYYLHPRDPSGLIRHGTLHTDDNPPTVLDNVTDGTELSVDDLGDSKQSYIPLNIIRNGNDIYIRTTVDVPTKYKNVDPFEYTELESIDQIDWGWTYYRPTKEYAPFDGKKYTYLEEDNIVIYEIRANKDFDVVAINGLISSLIRIEVYDTDDITIIETKEYIPNCTSNLAGKNKVRQDTAIVYLDEEYPSNTKIKVTFYPVDDYLRIGGGYFGNKNVVGFTNLEFTNEIIDFNYYEQDEFGNVIYTGDKNAKVRKFIGTADIHIAEYDDVEPVLRGMLSDKIIVDGSDNWENKTTDSRNYFNSSMIIGRLRRASQKTKLKNNRLDQMATYSFTIEEDI